MKKLILAVVIAFIAGVLLTYTMVPAKTITETKEVEVKVESEEQAKTIAELKEKLKTSEKIKYVYRDGKIVTKYVDRVIVKESATDTKTDTSIKKETDKKSKTDTEIKINEKKLIITGGFLVNKDDLYRKTYMAGFLYNIIDLPILGDIYIGGDLMVGDIRGGMVKIGIGI